MDNDKELVPISLRYYKGIFDIDEFEKQKKTLLKSGIYIREYDKNNKYMASADDIMNMISIVINNPSLQYLIAGVVLPGMYYDAFKAAVIWMWKSVKGKTINVAYANGYIEQKGVTFGFDIKCGNDNISLKLSGDVSDEDKSVCIDKAFEMLQDRIKDTPKPSLNHGRNLIGEYNQENQEWNLEDLYEIVKRKIQKQS